MSGPGKLPSKTEDNFSVKETMQKLFRFGKSSAPLTVPKSTTKEVTFTPDILRVSLRFLFYRSICCKYYLFISIV